MDAKALFAEVLPVLGLHGAINYTNRSGAARGSF